MKAAVQYLLLIAPLLLMASGFDDEITPAAILSGKYQNLLADNPEYHQHTNKYKQAVRTKKTCLKQLDSLFTIETIQLWPVEEQKKLQTLSKLAKNDIPGDVYEQLKTYGAEYAFTLNKMIPLQEVYSLERNMILAGQDIEKTENWAETLAAAAHYFNDDFVEGKLTKDIFYYGTVLSIEKDLQAVLKKHKDNLSQYPVQDKFAFSLYRRWKNYYSAVKLSTDREALFRILQERFDRPTR